MRLIDADALKKHYSWWRDEYKDIFDNIIDQQPTVSEPHKGTWIFDQKSKRFKCSECWAVASRDDFGKEYLSDYCTVCGARMEKE